MGALTDIKVYLTQAHPCGYWHDRPARDLVLDPMEPALPALYEQALGLGFRRSGRHVYRPHCGLCTACLPVRVPVAAFRPDRSQRRTWKRNADLVMSVGPAKRSAEHFALYERYLGARHPDSPMADPNETEFDQFLVGDWSPTRFFEWRLDGRLVAVAVTDVTPNALSAVYTFFDPDLPARGLGTLAILGQIDWARRTARPHLYLGFWLKHHPKMHYKCRFRPLERLWNGHWIAFDGAPA
ncbi:MAG: putative arginyl-tRNA--protein transferase [Silanimonas sp.]|nr:MAG: putative arginyl-tRNA--protein transferase [Silanimonas sp.]